MQIYRDVRNMMQEMIEDTSNSLNLHIEIIGNDLTRVCGTGKLKNDIGEKVVGDGIVSTLLKSGHCLQMSLKNRQLDSHCKLCSAYDNGICKYKKAVYRKIIFNNEIIGALGIASFDNDNDSDFSKYGEQVLYDFLNKMNKVICTSLNESFVKEQVKTSNKTIHYLMNQVDVGILILDKKMKVQDMNDLCEKKFMMNRTKSLNKDVKIVLPEIDIDCSARKKITYKGKVLNYHVEKITDEADSFENAIIYLDSEKEFKKTTANEGPLEDIIGTNEAFVEFKQKVLQIAPIESTVLLVGETGTGKELFARAIHKNSLRENKPFVTINCSAIPESLIESTLFGYEKGSFTGASPAGKDGKFFAANSGTVFLDELEAIPVNIQTKLLRVIENRTIEKVGSVKETYIDIRLIGATNIELEKLVEEGKFREDLYHRLNVIPLYIPPLRERKDDILVLADYFIDIYSKKFNKYIKGLDEETKNIFLYYNWKGNVRELKNAVEFSVLLEKTEYITKGSLPHQIIYKKPRTKIFTLAELERRQIVEALNTFGYSNEAKKEAANALGISRATLYRKIKEYLIED